MKEVIEKLIGRLEELPTKAITRYKGGAFGDYEGTDYFIDKYKTKDIINELAEEYKGGWIPCSERLPKPIDDMLQCVIVTNKNDWQGMAYYHPQKGWIFAECNNSDRKIDWTEIVAWQPLPAPYKEGE